MSPVCPVDNLTRGLARCMPVAGSHGGVRRVNGRDNKRRVGMKVLSSVIVVVGLVLPQAWVFAADGPVGAKKAVATGKASGNSQKGATPGKGEAKSEVPTGPTVVLEADGVAFGMSAEDVAKLYDRWWDKQFIARYQKANPGPRMRELDFELAEKKKVLRRVAIFDGRTTSFDKSEFHEEFAHGSGETMTSAKLSRRPAGDDKISKDAKPIGYTRRFFFYQAKLWKVYDEYKLDETSPFGADFKAATARVEAALGKTAKRTRGPESAFENVVFEAGNTRVRVVKLPADKLAVVRSDNALTKEVLDRRTQQANSADSAGLDDDIQAVIR
jgi:hypothetical protein